MTIDITAARNFVTTHGRVIDRRRLYLLLDGTDPDGVVAALDAYRNPDGGYGWGLEPDLRASRSQPVAAMQAFEVLAELAPDTTARSVELCDWLDAHTLADGGLPLALPVADRTGSATLWLDCDSDTSTLQMTAQVAANAHLVADHDRAVRHHPWLARATDWCLAVIGELDDAPDAYTLMFAIRFLDAAADTIDRADTLLDDLARHVPADGHLPVHGGLDGEALHPLDIAPRRDGPARRLFDHALIEVELDRLAQAQQADGGWTVEFDTASPAAALEWRAYTTVNTLKCLHDASAAP